MIMEVSKQLHDKLETNIDVIVKHDIRNIINYASEQAVQRYARNVILSSTTGLPLKVDDPIDIDLGSVRGKIVQSVCSVIEEHDHLH